MEEKTFKFDFLVQTKSKGIIKKRITKKHDSFNCALFADGITHISATTELEMNSDVVTYMLLGYKVDDEDYKKVNDENEFIEWEVK